MIYMVEMDFPHPERLSEWHHWYLAHVRVLQTVPGFRASQRFQAMFCPHLHAIHAMIGLREDMGQPQSAHPAQTEPHTVAVRRKVLVQQVGYAMRCIWASNSGMSSTRSVRIVTASFISAVYQHLWMASKFTRTVSH